MKNRKEIAFLTIVLFGISCYFTTSKVVSITFAIFMIMALMLVINSRKLLLLSIVPFILHTFGGIWLNTEGRFSLNLIGFALLFFVIKIPFP